jgi:serine/threonine protein kinase
MASGGAVDGRVDIYALGCVGYFLLTGKLVFEGETALQMILQHIQKEPVKPSVRSGRPLPSTSPTERGRTSRPTARRSD